MPEEEKLVAYCSCSIWKNLLVRGGLYISVNYVCFNGVSNPVSLSPASSPRSSQAASTFEISEKIIRNLRF